jgi:hypothetical protein
VLHLERLWVHHTVCLERMLRRPRVHQDEVEFFGRRTAVRISSFFPSVR